MAKPRQLVGRTGLTFRKPVVVALAALISRRHGTAPDQTRAALVPLFLIGFIALATVNSLGLLPVVVAETLSQASRWLLLVAIAAVGMKTSLKTVAEIGPQAIVLLVAETLFIASLVIFGLRLV